MKPQDVAAELGIRDFMYVCSKVEEKFNEKRFGVISITKNDEGKKVVVVSVKNDTYRLVI